MLAAAKQARDYTRSSVLVGGKQLRHNARHRLHTACNENEPDFQSASDHGVAAGRVQLVHGLRLARPPEKFGDFAVVCSGAVSDGRGVFHL